jgi:hypothetical protein
MLTLSVTILHQLNAVWIVTLVLFSLIVFSFAASANQSDFVSHNGTSLKKADSVGLVKKIAIRGG